MNEHRTQLIRSSLDAIVSILVPQVEFEKLLNALPEHGLDLSPTRRQSLEDLARFQGHDRGIGEHLIRKLERAPERRSIESLLIKLHSRWWNRILFGVGRSISEMNDQEKRMAIRCWSASPLPRIRAAWWGLKRAVLFTAYAKPDEKGEHPLWSTIDYARPVSVYPETAEKSSPRLSLPFRDWLAPPGTLEPIESRLKPNSATDFDAIVVGSGAAGGVAAALLSRAGQNVLVLEHGKEPARHDFGRSEWEGNRTLFDKQGALATVDQRITILAGHTVGGGTVVNWMTSLPVSQAVRSEWRKHFGINLLGDSWDRAVDSIQKRLGIAATPQHVNAQNECLRRGCEARSISWKYLPRNGQCGDCGFCGFGCSKSEKQDVRQTFLYDAAQHQATIVSEARVLRLVTQGSRVIGVEVRERGAADDAKPTTIFARQVVLACGAIHTPLLLQRSRLGNRHVGRHLQLHPTTAIASFFPQPIRPWEGAPQTIICDQWTQLSGGERGVRLEVAPVHPGFAALALSWESGLQHKSWLAQLDRLASIVVLARDSGSGTVRASGDRVELRYRMSRQDWQNLARGVAEALRIHQAAGASWSAAPFHTPFSSRCDSAQWSGFVESVQTQVARGLDVPLYSAHQMSSCRMSSQSSSGAIDEWGKPWGVEGLTILDSSALPGATGVNPMLSIMSLAYWQTERLLERTR